MITNAMDDVGLIVLLLFLLLGALPSGARPFVTCVASKILDPAPRAKAFRLNRSRVPLAASSSAPFVKVNGIRTASVITLSSSLPPPRQRRISVVVVVVGNRALSEPRARLLRRATRVAEAAAAAVAISFRIFCVAVRRRWKHPARTVPSIRRPSSGVPFVTF